MKPKLKIGGIRNLHDARYCAAVGIDFLGFDFQNPKAEGMDAKTVGEIMEWISGPESIAEFGHEQPEEIQEALQELKANYVSLPLDYKKEWAGKISGNLIFSGEKGPLGRKELEGMLELAVHFPNALFEYAISEKDDRLWAFIQDKGLMERSILRFEEAAACFSVLERKGEQAFGFALGGFVEDSEEGLDYEACDEFLERYSEIMSPA